MMLRMIGLKFLIEQEEFIEFQRKEAEEKEYAELVGIKYEANITPSYTSIVTDKLAIRLSEISSVTQYYRKLDTEKTISERDEISIRNAFTNLEDFSFDSVPLLSIEMKSGNTIYDVMGTMEYLLKEIENAENNNN